MVLDPADTAVPPAGRHPDRPARVAAFPSPHEHAADQRRALAHRVDAAQMIAIPGGPTWLRDFFPGYFAMVMGTGIVAVAARILHFSALAWPLFAIAVIGYGVLWIIVLARMVRHPRAVIADFVSHERGPTFLTIVTANGVLGSQFD